MISQHYPPAVLNDRQQKKSLLYGLFPIVLLLTLLLPAREANGAISYVQDVGAFSQYYGFGPSSIVIPVTASVAAGNSIIVTLTWGAWGPGEITTCSDTKGNSYTTDVSEFYSGAGLYTIICSSHNVTALSTSDTINVSFTSGTYGVAATAHEFSGLAPSLALDQTAKANGSSTTPSSGNTATTAQADELLVGAIGVSGLPTDAFTPGGGYTALNAVGFTGVWNGTIRPEYKVVSATGVYQADGVLGVSAGWSATIATYKAAASTINITISGTLYSDEGITPLSAQTVRLLVEGVSAGTDITDAAGGYSITATINPGNIWYIPLLVYVDNGAAVATTVTTMDSTTNSATISNLDLYADHLVVRDDNGGAPTDTGDMLNAMDPYSDTDLLYSISWPDMTVTGANTELYVAGGHFFTPFGNVTTPNMKIVGTLNAGDSTYMNASDRVFTVSGDWDHSSGAFNQGVSTVNFTGSGTINADSGSWWNKPFYNVTAAAAGQTTTIAPGQGIAVENDLVLGSGTLAGGEVILNKSSGTPLTTSATLNNSFFMYSTETTGTVFIAPANYPDLRIAGWTSGATNTFELAGNISCNSLSVAGTDSGSTTILDTSAGSYSISCSSLEVGAGWDTSVYNSLVLNGSAVTVSGDVTIYPSDAGGANRIDAGSSIIDVGGNWSNSDTFTAGTSTVNLTGTGQGLNGSTTFYNLTKTVTSTDTLTFAAGSTQTITGTATLNGASGQLLSLRSSAAPTQWNFNLATGASKAISYVDVQDANASGSDSSLVDINPAYSFDSGNNVSWFGNANITVLKSSSVISDPINGTVNPKRIPGAIVEYTIRVTNTAGAQATDVTITDDLSGESATLSFLPDGYGVTGEGILLSINGGTALALTNAADSDQGDFNTATDTLTVGGIVLDAGDYAVVTFRVTIQ